jgi:hypothetical protein
MKRVRLFGISITDLILAVIGMVIVFLLAHHYHFKKMNALPFVIAAILLTIPLGIIFHVIFGVNTKLNSLLGLSHAPKIVKS